MTVSFFAAGNGSWIRATPALDEGRLYVAGMRDVMVCLDAASGDVVWKFDFVEQQKTPLPSFGFVSSPLVSGPWVYVQAAASLLKLDKLAGVDPDNGRVLWSQDIQAFRGMNILNPKHTGLLIRQVFDPLRSH